LARLLDRTKAMASAPSSSRTPGARDLVVQELAITLLAKGGVRLLTPRAII
jgi:hypothetical protein